MRYASLLLFGNRHVKAQGYWAEVIVGVTLHVYHRLATRAQPSNAKQQLGFDLPRPRKNTWQRVADMSSST